MKAWLVVSMLCLVGGSARAGEHLASDDAPSLAAARRAELSAEIPIGSLLVLWAAKPRAYSLDVLYPYRQDSDFFYVTGLYTYPAIYVMVRSATGYSEWLFGDVEAFPGGTALSSEIRSLGAFEGVIMRLLRGRPAGEDPRRYRGELDEWRATVAAGRAKLLVRVPVTQRLGDPLDEALTFAERVRQHLPGVSIGDVSPALHRRRRVKSRVELELLRKSAEISARALARAAKIVRGGGTEREAAASVESECRAFGDGASFPPVVSTGGGGAALHAAPRNNPGHAGELALVDAGCTVDGYASDITRTIPMRDKFTDDQAAVYDAVLRALKAAEQTLRPGVTLSEVEGAIRGSLSADVSSSDWESRFGAGDVDDLAPPGMVHFVGIDVHDVGDPWAPLEEGVVVAVEPGLYLSRASRETATRGLANVRIEDVYVIEASGAKRVTDALPRERRAVEEWVADATGRHGPLQ